MNTRIRVVAAYRFVDEWHVPASPEWVYGLLSCPREYPEWWGDAFLQGEGDPGPAAPGKRARLLTRGRLPYRCGGGGLAGDLGPDGGGDDAHARR